MSDQDMARCAKGHVLDEVGNCTACEYLGSRAVAGTDGGSPQGDRLPPIGLAALLDDVRAFIRRYVVLTDAQADAVALWVLHTWALDAAECTPYLSVTSAEKRSGKTRLLEVLSLLVARPWFTGRVTAAVLVRKVAKDSPTLLLDESDAAFRGEKEYAETLRAVLNAGYRRGGVASLCVKPGGDFDLRDFPVFGPKAIAGIGRLPDTVADRAIPIALKRRAPGEAIARLRQRQAKEEAGPIGERLESWAAAGSEALTEAQPDIPPELDDRAADVWEPLLAIADAAQRDWPERGRKAALALSVGDGRDDDSLGVRLLRDIQGVFEERKADRLTSGELVEALVVMEEAPWGDLKGKPLDARSLARRLRPYDVRPHNVRLGDGTQAKGYATGDLDDAWSRYVSQGTVPSVPSVPLPTAEPNSGDSSGTDGTDGTANSGIHPPPAGVLSLPHDDGQRLYVHSLAQELGFPAVSLGERQRNGRTVSVGVPGGRFAWEQAARFWPVDELGELLGRLEEMAGAADVPP